MENVSNDAVLRFLTGLFNRSVGFDDITIIKHLIVLVNKNKEQPKHPENKEDTSKTMNIVAQGLINRVELLIKQKRMDEAKILAENITMEHSANLTENQLKHLVNDLMPSLYPEKPNPPVETKVSKVPGMMNKLKFLVTDTACLQEAYKLAQIIRNQYSETMSDAEIKDFGGIYTQLCKDMSKIKQLEEENLSLSSKIRMLEQEKNLYHDKLMAVEQDYKRTAEQLSLRIQSLQGEVEKSRPSQEIITKYRNVIENIIAQVYKKDPSYLLPRCLKQIEGAKDEYLKEHHRGFNIALLESIKAIIHHGFDDIIVAYLKLNDSDIV